ncbi:MULTISPECIES: phospholipase D family protein [unclassified Tatumella]|uniref:phospholipase D family nuclease n=1 Tax=unclassified Tatumella TaxID=2649542 RepID=UPI001BB02C90|nr:MULTISPECIES: phospholipase D family protein [unclassified Tatumella]MBS0876530.1 phospholipase D family protein [Tatumella sp. JGM82]MBS0890083.1 phospholipase D family protein [Tatumella sp. JGM94]MBS0901327.1 phospholipase D family protein [Tatumella sp. JGM100]
MKKTGYLLTALLLGSPWLTMAAEPQIEAGFSPEGTARTLVLETINSAHSSIRMLAYSFTAPDIMQALANASKRGVDIKIVVDEKGNKGKASLAAMNFIVNNGIPLRTDRHYPIQHDKTLIVDDQTVETGSFNYTASAEKRNSENVVVIHNSPSLAQAYLKHWQVRWDYGQDYQSAY